MRYLLCIVLLTGCSAQSNMSCISESVESVGVLKDTEKRNRCSCTCPVPQANVIETGGILGGILSLFNKD